MSMCLRGMHMDSLTFVTFKVITAVSDEVSVLLGCEAVLLRRTVSNILHTPCCVSEFTWQQDLYLAVFVSK